MRLKQFDSLPSTHRYCELLDLTQEEEFTVICATEQSGGEGQRGNRWESRSGENITLSIILHPRLLPVADQYMLTKVLSLSLLDMLTPLLPEKEVKIKWPNDIYVDGDKICGILLTHQIVGGLLRSSICSVGLNVNQTEFSEWIPNPTSLAKLTGERRALEPMVVALVEAVERRYRQLSNNDWAGLDEAYLSHLLHYREEAEYHYAGRDLRATIEGVNRFGHLQLITREGEHLSCEMKEIRLKLGKYNNC